MERKEYELFYIYYRDGEDWRFSEKCSRERANFLVPFLESCGNIVLVRRRLTTYYDYYTTNDFDYKIGESTKGDSILMDNHDQWRLK